MEPILFKDLETSLVVAAPMETGWPMKNGVQMCSIQEAIQRVEEHFG